MITWKLCICELFFRRRIVFASFLGCQLGCSVDTTHVRPRRTNVWIKLDQVYCAWLIKWGLKREIIQLAELCLSRWWIKSGTWWYWISIWRYSLVLGQYKLELLGFRWYRVSKGLECLYILEKVEIWSGDTDVWHTALTDRHQNIGLLSLSPV